MSRSGLYRRFARCGVQALAAASFLLTIPVAAQHITFTRLGFLNDDPTLPPSSQALGISADGTKVVGMSAIYDQSIELTEAHAFLWTLQNGMRDLGRVDGGLEATLASAVSNDGRTIVGATGFLLGTFEIRNGAYWRRPHSGGVQTGVGQSVYYFSDVTSRGDAVAGTFRIPKLPYPIYDSGFLYTPARGYERFGILPGGTYSAAEAMSDDASIVVGFGDNASHITAVIWNRSEGLRELHGMPDVPSQATGISSDGSSVIGIINNFDAFLWTESGGVEIIATGSQPTDVSADGRVVVGKCDTCGEGGTPSSFIWMQSTGMVELKTALSNAGVDVSGWTLTAATAISDNARTVVGYGTNPDGLTEGWVASMRP